MILHIFNTATKFILVLFTDRLLVMAPTILWTSFWTIVTFLEGDVCCIVRLSPPTPPQDPGRALSLALVTPAVCRCCSWVVKGADLVYYRY
jgi:hypothetical protein